LTTVNESNAVKISQCIGVGYRRPLAQWILSRPAEIQCLEITAEHFFDDPDTLQLLKGRYPLMLHGLGLSLGTPGPLDQTYLQQFVHVCRQADPLWVSEHIAFTRSGHVDLGHLNPIPYTEATLALMVDHTQELAQACDKPVILENITSHLHIPGTLTEPEFINRLCEKAGCGLLLDVTNAYVNSRNHNFDVRQWLHQINPDVIQQLHIVGYANEQGVFYDSHSQDIQWELYEFTQTVVEYCQVQSIIIERDNNIPAADQIQTEILQLQQCLGWTQNDAA